MLDLFLDDYANNINDIYVTYNLNIITIKI